MIRRIASVGLAAVLAVPLNLLASPIPTRPSRATSTTFFAQTALQGALLASPLHAFVYESKVQLIRRERLELMPIPRTLVGLLLTTCIQMPKVLSRSAYYPEYADLLARYGELRGLLLRNKVENVQRQLLTEIAPKANIGFHFTAPMMEFILNERRDPKPLGSVRQRVHGEILALADQFAREHHNAFVDDQAAGVLTSQTLTEIEIKLLASEVGMWLVGLEMLAIQHIVMHDFSVEQLIADMRNEGAFIAAERAEYAKAVYAHEPGYAYRPYAVAFATTWGNLLRISFTSPKRLKTVRSERYFDDLVAKYPALSNVLDDIPALQEMITDVIAPKEETELLFITPMVKLVLDLQKSCLSHEFLLPIMLQQLEHIAIDAAARHSLAVIPIDKAPYYKIVNLNRHRRYALMNTFHSWYAPESLQFLPMIIEKWDMKDVRAFLEQLLAEKLEMLHAGVNRNVRRRATGFRNSPYLTVIAA